MNTCIRIVLLYSISIFCFPEITLSQESPIKDNHRVYPGKGISGAAALQAQKNFIPRKTIHFSTTDWRKLIDSVWGPGLPTNEKLMLFDTLWTIADRQYGGFPNLAVNWNAIRDRYRPEVSAGVSRGRFYAIMSQLAASLQEVHTYVYDTGADSVFYNTEFGKWWSVPGIPLSIVGGWGLTTSGLGVSPLPDSSMLVYRAQADNPLGIKPGDVILGYEGKKWTEILRALDSIQLPCYAALFGTDQEGFRYSQMNAASALWHLFDTVDVVQYSTGKTLHLPTQPLADAVPGWDKLYCTDQIPVPGVSMPDALNNVMCSWGVIEGTTIGYIYAYDWSTVKASFTKAMQDLRNKTTGLILDWRFNMGGNPNQANEAFATLFNENVDRYYDFVHRSSLTDHFLFTHQSVASTFVGAFTPGNSVYDHPIAVLTGPACLSAGDYNAFRMRTHPMVRFFGKRTNTGYVDGYYSNGRLFKDPWIYQISKGGSFSFYDNEEYLLHKGFPVDEEVWFTKENASKGEDDVVKRAVEWIKTTSYSHSISINKSLLNPNGDSLIVTAVVKNPLSHILSVSAALKQLNTLTIDSVKLFNDGIHNDGAPNDTVWGATLKIPAIENFYYATITTNNLTTGTSRTLPIRKPSITSAGPVVCLGETSAVVPQWGKTIVFRFKIFNEGKSATVPGLSGTIRSLDTSAIITAGFTLNLGDLLPGQQKLSSVIGVKFSSSQTVSRYIPFEFVFSSSSIEYWRDTVFIKVDNSTNVVLNESLPLTFALEQNYPNPFNPSTTIRYSLPSSANVKLAVYDLLGREITTLVNEEQSAGWKEVEWNARQTNGWQASSFSSGIYFYKLTAGNYVETKKMILMK